MSAEDRIKKQQEEKEYWHVMKVAEAERLRQEKKDMMQL